MMLILVNKVISGNKKEIIVKKNKAAFKKWLIGIIDGAGNFKEYNNNFVVEIKDEKHMTIELLEHIKKNLGGIGEIKINNNDNAYIIQDKKEIKNILFPILQEAPLLIAEKQLQYLNFYNKIMENEENYKGIIVKKEGKDIRIPELKKTSIEENIYVKIVNGESWEKIMKEVKIEGEWILGIMNGSNNIRQSEFMDGKTGLNSYNIIYTKEIYVLLLTRKKIKKFNVTNIKKLYEKKKDLYVGQDKNKIEEFFNSWESDKRLKKQRRFEQKEKKEKKI